MSMSTQHGGGNRKPSTRPVAGGKPKQGDDEEIVEEVLEPEAADSDTDADVAAGAADVADVDEADEADEAPPVRTVPRKSASTRKSAAAGKSRPTGKAAGTKTTGTKTTGAKAGSKAVGSKATGGKATNGKAPGGQVGGSRPGARPAGRAGARKVAPVKVSQGRPWGAIALFTTVALIALGIIGFASWQVYQHGLSWSDRADRIDGLVDYRKTKPELVKQRNHEWGPIKYDMAPPVAGTHNYNWQRCLGDVYDAPIATEHALHSMEHGAVWITYDPSLPTDQVEQLAKKVRGQDYLLMSPFPGQDKPISLQAWGYQLKVSKASDSRIDEFIKALKQNASLEPGTPCSSGNIITETGATPRDLGKDQPPQTGG